MSGVDPGCGCTLADAPKRRRRKRKMICTGVGKNRKCVPAAAKRRKK